MKIAFVTIFPELVAGASAEGVTAKARERGLWEMACFSPRNFAPPPHRKIDDRPYGGGPGMVMMHEPLAAAIGAAKAWIAPRNSEINAQSAPQVLTVLMSPAGRPFSQQTARKWRALDGLVLVCGRYEGIDERTVQSCIDAEASLGDFVLSGGEFAALAMCDAIVRLIPGVLGDSQSAAQESFAFGLLDHPHYTRPVDLGPIGAVPSVLLSGDHAAIARWRREQALTRTAEKRDDLLRNNSAVSSEDLAFLREKGYT